MPGVEYYAIRCAHCGLYQVQQVKKNPHFKCSVCSKQQKLQEEHFRGAAKQCREIVQRLNKAQHEGEIGFTPSARQSSQESAAIPSEKRKSAPDRPKNDTKRLKSATSERKRVPPKKSVLDRMSVEDEDLFPPENSEKPFEPSAATDAVIDRESTRQQKESDEDVDTNGKVGGNHVRSGNLEHDDDDDDIFDDIPSPPPLQTRTLAQNRSPSPTVKPPSGLPEQQERQNKEVVKQKLSTDDEKFCGTIPEVEAEAASDAVAMAIAPGSAYCEGRTAGKVPERSESDAVNEEQGSSEKIEMKIETNVQGDWRRRSLNKLARFKFDLEDDSTEETPAENRTVSTAASVSQGNRIESEVSIPRENTSRRQRRLTDSEDPPESPQRPKSVSENCSSLSPGGRDRLLATLQKFKRAPKQKS